MLSYRHAFHAGNHADVLKHLALVKCLGHMVQKPGPILYIDTHAGAGRYPLHNDIMCKTNEYKHGAGALRLAELPKEFQDYGQLLAQCRQEGYYPGSPLLAAKLLREQDKLFLFELHPGDFPALAALFARDRRVKVERSDGYRALNALLPGHYKRALILMDPSFEIKSDYTQTILSLKAGYRRMPNATYLLWYPVVQRQWIDRLLKQLRNSGMRDVWQFELGVATDSDGHGMTASGVAIINPPWRLPEQMRLLLPQIQQQLAPQDGYHQILNIVPE